MDFGKAIEALKQGKKLSREGWNGKCQYIILARMVVCVTEDGKRIDRTRHEQIGDKFIMFVGTSGQQCGWLASQADMLSEDWYIVD